MVLHSSLLLRKFFEAWDSKLSLILVLGDLPHHHDNLGDHQKEADKLHYEGSTLNKSHIIPGFGIIKYLTEHIRNKLKEQFHGISNTQLEWKVLTWEHPEEACVEKKVQGRVEVNTRIIDISRPLSCSLCTIALVVVNRINVWLILPDVFGIIVLAHHKGKNDSHQDENASE